MLVIYNNYNNFDWMAHHGGLPRGTIILINNQSYDPAVVSHLRGFGYRPKYVMKLTEADSIDNKGDYLAMDAENYQGDIRYSMCLGHTFHPEILFPEDLGGDKYAHYAEFIEGINPQIVCMERTYNVWKPWELLQFWFRNKPLRDAGIVTCLGIWPESMPKCCRKIQGFFANLISGGDIFWYSETKSLPVIK